MKDFEIIRGKLTNEKNLTTKNDKHPILATEKNLMEKTIDGKPINIS